MTEDHTSVETPRVSVRVNDGPVQVTPMGNIDVATASPDSVMSSVKSPAGGRLFGDVTPDCIVTVGGVEMTIQQAQARGLVSLEDGKVLEQEPPSMPEVEAGPDEALEVDASVTDTLENWSGAIEAYTGSSHHVHGVVLEFIDDPSRLPSLLQTMATEQQMDPSAFHEEAKRVTGEIETALNDRLKGLGVDPESFGEYARKQRGAPVLNRAIAQLVTNGDFGPLNEMVQNYRSQGVGNTDDDKAPVSVTVNGQKIETTVANARRNGWL